jgi:Type II secretory pathway, component PulJ
MRSLRSLRPKNRAARASARAAFTLIELLIAGTISALLMAAAAIALAAGMRASARVAAAGNGAAEEAAFLRILQSDIASAAPLNGAKFAGDARAMAFARLASPGASAGSIEAARVEWRILPARGAVRTLTFASGATHSQSFALKNPPPFSYAGKPSDNSPPDAAFSETWAAENYPGLVRAGDLIFTIWTSNFSAREEAP